MYRTGYIKKAHGMKGEVIYMHESNHPLAEQQLLYVKQHSGDFTPVRIEQLKSAAALSDSSFFVLFSGIDNRSGAEEYKGLMVYSETEPVLDEAKAEAEPTVFDCIHYVISDQADDLSGTIKGVMDNPAHPIVVADIDHTEVLIPAVDAYITSIDHAQQLVTAQNLRVLLDLATDKG